MIEEQEEHGVKKTISDQNLQQIFFLLQEIQDHEIKMLDACREIYDYLQQILKGQNLENVMADIKVKNQDLMITKIKILLENCKQIISNKKYKEFDGRLRALKTYSIKHPVISLIKKTNKKSEAELQPSFNLIIKHLIELRPEILDELAHILFIEGNIKQNKNIKTKEGIEV